MRVGWHSLLDCEAECHLVGRQRPIMHLQVLLWLHPLLPW